MEDRNPNRGSASRLEDVAEENFDPDSLVLRRADPDDCDAIINLVEIGEDDLYNRVYAYPKILKLIETSYLAITVIDRGSGAVIGFAAFEDYPCGIRGLVDDRHYNYWEKWLSQACDVKEFSSFNSLWLQYFLLGSTMPIELTHCVFKQVLHMVYTSNPDLIGVLFMARGDADENDLKRCFQPMSRYFRKLEVKNESVLQAIRGIHPQSEFYFTSRMHVLPFIEIRRAQQEDHDDLADVFNSQSETVTEAYGEYFIAELIAGQNEDNCALVAQVKDKAVGLMGLTREVDLKLLQKCFKLDTFDNLLKPDLMQAVRERRRHLQEAQERKEQNEALTAKQTFADELLRCDVIAQRMELQEHLLKRGDEIIKVIDEYLQNEDEAKEVLSQDFVMNELFGNWLENFHIYQPTEYFLENPMLQTDDTDLDHNVLTEMEFLMSTLEIFGLPKDYINGCGHHLNWRDKSNEEKKKKKGKKKAKTQGAAARLAQKMGVNQKEELVKPTYFDLGPFQKALRRYLCANADARSNLRCTLHDRFTEVRSVFKDKYGELSFKRVVDIHEMVDQLNELGFGLDGLIGESLGSILLCFGGIEVLRHWGDRPPPETDEQKRAKANLNFLYGERAKFEEDKRKKLKRGETVVGPGGHQLHSEEEKTQDELDLDVKIVELQEKVKPKSLIKVPLADTSIDDMIVCLKNMQTFDRFLSRNGLTKKRDWAIENKLLEKIKMPWVEHFGLLEEVAEHATYSTIPEIQRICEEIMDTTAIPDAPESAKNAFAVTLFCMESAFDCRSKDFLKYAFDSFPERDYLIVTQPHTVPESALLNKFTLVQKQSINTFQHVLYIFHRDYLFEEDMRVCRSLGPHLDGIRELIESSGENEVRAEEILSQVQTAIKHENASPFTSYTATCYDQVVGTLLLSRDVNLDYYVSHFHLQDQLLLGEHERASHARLVYAIINPIFEKSTRWLIKEALRLAGKTCIYFEVNDSTVIPQIFHELVHVRCRRFPHLLDRKWDHEHWDAAGGDGNGDDSVDHSSSQREGASPYGAVEIAIDGAERNPVDEQEASFALCFQSKRLLSEAKIPKNGRVVVVGASDTGISFVEALLSISYLQFTNVTLVAPGGLPHQNLVRRQANLKAASTSYTYTELKKLMLESRVSVINARMTDIDRSDKNIILHDGSVLPYDTLVLAMGIQEKTLSTLGYVSQGVEPLPEGASQARGVLSIDDPFLYKYLAGDGQLMGRLTDRRRQTNVVVYGRSLNTFTLVQGLLDRGVQPKCITLAVPRPQCHVNEADADAQLDEDMPWINPDAFEDVALHEKIEKNLIERGVNVMHECRLMEIITDRELSSSRPNTHRRGGDHSDARDTARTGLQQAMPNLQKVLLKRLDIPDEEEEEDEFEQEEMGERSDEDAGAAGTAGANGAAGADESGLIENEEASRSEKHEKRKKRKKNEVEIDCGVLVTCGHRDVDVDVFNAIHNNGLVYNGRLIVDKHFQTTDKSVFAAGTLCEFSNKYLSLVGGRSLRMDRYNGREMGARLARSVFDLYDPQSDLNMLEERGDEEVPLFYLPQGSGGILPRDLIYYHIRTTNPLFFGTQQTDFKNRPDLICDNLDLGAGKGTYLKFTFNSIGLIDSVTYMGNEEVILQSLWCFVGLHENYLNQLTSRFDANIIPCVVEFLSENWAIALYHEWFGDFCLRMRQSVKGLGDVQLLLKQSLELSKSGLGLTRENLQQLRSNMSSDSQKLIEDETLEFIKTNMNHLPMYYIPSKEFK